MCIKASSQVNGGKDKVFKVYGQKDWIVFCKKIKLNPFFTPRQMLNEKFTLVKNEIMQKKETWTNCFLTWEWGKPSSL